METSTGTLIFMTVMLVATAIYVFGEEELHKKIKRFFTRNNWKKKNDSLKFKKK
ncbi:MAG TPA: hypothetical protein PLS10_08510 [Chitinophagales bacterium]|nr:hypothetical protein [Chitinophagales bacterium]